MNSVIYYEALHEIFYITWISDADTWDKNKSLCCISLYFQLIYEW